jgi:hypothetical protein
MLVESSIFGVSFRDIVGTNYGASFACDIFKISEAGVFAARLMALLMVNYPSDFRRGKSNFDVLSSDPRGGGGENSSGDHGDWVYVVILG